MCISNGCMRTTWNSIKMQQKDTIWGIWSHITLHPVFSGKMEHSKNIPKPLWIRILFPTFPHETCHFGFKVTQFPDPRPISGRGLEICSFFELRIESLNYDSCWKMKRLNIWSMRMKGGPRFCFWIRPASMVVLVFSAKIRVSWDANLIVGWPGPFTSSIWRQRFVVPMVHLGLLWIAFIFIYVHLYVHHFLTSWPNNSNMSFVTWQLNTIGTYDTYKSTRRRWRERFPGTFYNPIDIKWPGRDEFGGALPFLTGVHDEKNGGSHRT